MNFCIITPIAGLERYATLSKTHLVLAQIKDPRYREFYLKRREAGDTLILDNGAYEEGENISPEEFAATAYYYQPQWVVCPDKPFACWKETYDRIRDFFDLYFDMFRNMKCNFMGIPHTTEGDLLGWIGGLLVMMDDFPLDGIGIPRALATHYWKEDPFIRAKAAEFIGNRWKNLYIHAMGMANGSVQELNALRNAGADSCDSSAPVWRGWNDYSLTSLQDLANWNLGGTACDFNAELPNRMDIDVLIKQNVEACGVNTNVNGDR